MARCLGKRIRRHSLSYVLPMVGCPKTFVVSGRDMRVYAVGGFKPAIRNLNTHAPPSCEGIYAWSSAANTSATLTAAPPLPSDALTSRMPSSMARRSWVSSSNGVMACTRLSGVT